MLSFDSFDCQSKPFLVFIWPDGEWVLGEDFSEASHKSDDYEILDLNDYHAMQRYHDQKLLTEIVSELMGDYP